VSFIPKGSKIRRLRTAPSGSPSIHAIRNPSRSVAQLYDIIAPGWPIKGNCASLAIQSSGTTWLSISPPSASRYACAISPRLKSAYVRPARCVRRSSNVMSRSAGSVSSSGPLSHAFGEQWLRSVTKEEDLPMPADQLVRVIHALTEGLVFQRLLTPKLMPDEVFHAAFAALEKRPKKTNAFDFGGSRNWSPQVPFREVATH